MYKFFKFSGSMNSIELYIFSKILQIKISNFYNFTIQNIVEYFLTMHLRI